MDISHEYQSCYVQIDTRLVKFDFPWFSIGKWILFDKAFNDYDQEKKSQYDYESDIDSQHLSDSDDDEENAYQVTLSEFYHAVGIFMLRAPHIKSLTINK